MPIKRTKNWTQVNAQLKTIVQEAVSASAITLENEMTVMLSKPGRGRVYARGKAGAKFDKIGRFGEISRTMATAERFGELLARRAARANGTRRKNMTRRAQGFHRASRPGDPPAVDTGHLRQNIDSDKSQVKSMQPTARVGTNVKYGRDLEFGTRKVAPRPWARPSAKKARPKIVSVFKTMLSRIGRVT